jgi:hypothetical protein
VEDSEDSLRTRFERVFLATSKESQIRRISITSAMFQTHCFDMLLVLGRSGQFLSVADFRRFMSEIGEFVLSYSGIEDQAGVH